MVTSLIGRPAPGFDLDAVSFDDRNPRRVTLSSYSGRWLLLLFYPRDFSFVCPTELTAFSASIDEFRRRECDILGLSVDSIEDHVRWLESPVQDGGIGPLQFPLASDAGGELSRAYGAWLEEGHCSARGLFLIDPDGNLQYSVAHNTSVGRSTEETLRVLDALQSGGLCPASWTNADGTIDVEAQLQPGRILGNFRIVKALGVGAFGSVFAADDLSLERRVALKVIGRKASTARDQVLAEARAAARLHHRNICTIFSVETVETVPVIVMEFVDGRPLSQCDLNSLTDQSRREIAIGIAEGLAEAHANGIAHGDLKPANVMISRIGEAKLLDFGLSRRDGRPNVALTSAASVPADEAPLDETMVFEPLGDLNQVHAAGLTGTPAYMSPEMTFGAPASLPADVYAFGLILVQLLTGRFPVELTGLAEVLNQIRSGKVRQSAIEMVPGDFKEVIASTLAERPEDRPTMQDRIPVLKSKTFLSSE